MVVPKRSRRPSCCRVHNNKIHGMMHMYYYTSYTYPTQMPHSVKLKENYTWFDNDRTPFSGSIIKRCGFFETLTERACRCVQCSCKAETAAHVKRLQSSVLCVPSPAGCAAPWAQNEMATCEMNSVVSGQPRQIARPGTSPHAFFAGKRTFAIVFLRYFDDDCASAGKKVGKIGIRGPLTLRSIQLRSISGRSSFSLRKCSHSFRSISVHFEKVFTLV